MGLLTRLSAWDKDTYGNGVKTLRVLIECEQGSVHKYEYDDANDVMVIVRDLDSKYPYPYSYGSIPQTLAGDGDCLDAVVITDSPIRTGTVLNCTPVAIIYMDDNGEKDNKILCVPFYADSKKINLKKVVHYLCNYKYPHQDGTRFLGIGKEQQAIKEIEKAIVAFKENKK